MKKHPIIIVILLLILTFVLCGCTDDYVHGKGEITYNDFEGGFYGIISDDGKFYDPVNLKSDFEEDRLKIRFILEILEDQASIHQWGMIVRIIKIEKL